MVGEGAGGWLRIDGLAKAVALAMADTFETEVWALAERRLKKKILLPEQREGVVEQVGYNLFLMKKSNCARKQTVVDRTSALAAGSCNSVQERFLSGEICVRHNDTPGYVEGEVEVGLRIGAIRAIGNCSSSATRTWTGAGNLAADTQPVCMVDDLC